MQVLHVHWLAPTQAGVAGRLNIWSETAAAGQPKRDRRKKSAQLHPFTTGAGELRKLLVQTGLRGKTPEDILTLWLPTDLRGPVPSPELLHDWEADDSPPELLPWSVTGLRLEAGQALHLFSYWQQQSLPPRIRRGADAGFWQTVFLFTLEILARQLVRPTPAILKVKLTREKRREMEPQKPVICTQKRQQLG